MEAVLGKNGTCKVRAKKIPKNTPANSIYITTKIQRVSQSKNRFSHPRA